MGGKPSKQTPRDMRLASNKAKYGTTSNRDAKVPTTTSKVVQPKSVALPKKEGT